MTTKERKKKSQALDLVERYSFSVNRTDDHARARSTYCTTMMVSFRPQRGIGRLALVGVFAVVAVIITIQAFVLFRLRGDRTRAVIIPVGMMTMDKNNKPLLPKEMTIARESIGDQNPIQMGRPPLTWTPSSPQVKARQAQPYAVEDILSGAPSVILVYPLMNFGLLCNALHQLSVGLDLALSFPPEDKRRVVIAFDTNTTQKIRAALDVNFLVESAKHASKLDIPDLLIGRTGSLEPLHDVDVAFDWVDELHLRSALAAKHTVLHLKPIRFMRIQAAAFSFSLTFLMRPHPLLRSPADELIDRFRRERPENLLIAVHRRNFLWCKNDSRAYYPFCGDRNDPSRLFQWRYYEDDCNVTYSDRLMESVWRQYDLDTATPSQKRNGRPFSFFVASDLHDVGGDATFGMEHQVLHIPHKENPEHAVSQEMMTWKLGQVFFLKDVVMERTGFDIHWDYSMLTDMHAETRADFALGSPWSSCDRILAMWRSGYGVSAFKAFERSSNYLEELDAWIRENGKGRIRTYPRQCYKEFETPVDPLNFINPARLWWRNEAMQVLNGPRGRTLKDLKNPISGVERIAT